MNMSVQNPELGLVLGEISLLSSWLLGNKKQIVSLVGENCLTLVDSVASVPYKFKRS